MTRKSPREVNVNKYGQKKNKKSKTWSEKRGRRAQTRTEEKTQRKTQLLHDFLYQIRFLYLLSLKKIGEKSLLVPIFSGDFYFSPCRYIRNGGSWRGKRQK